jgi:predicted DNA-binding WGR domain protein
VSPREGPDDPHWTLFRYCNADGSSKDWAYRRLADGAIEICWGRTGAVSQRQTCSAGDAGAILRRAQQKQRKGYVPLGNAELRRGALQPIPDATPTQTPPSPLRPKPSLPAVDLSQIAAGQDDFWF